MVHTTKDFLWSNRKPFSDTLIVDVVRSFQPFCLFTAFGRLFYTRPSADARIPTTKDFLGSNRKPISSWTPSLIVDVAQSLSLAFVHKSEHLFTAFGRLSHTAFGRTRPSAACRCRLLRCIQELVFFTHSLSPSFFTFPFHVLSRSPFPLLFSFSSSIISPWSF